MEGGEEKQRIFFLSAIAFPQPMSFPRVSIFIRKID